MNFNKGVRKKFYLFTCTFALKLFLFSTGAVHAHATFSIMDSPTPKETDLAFRTPITNSMRKNVKEYLNHIYKVAHNLTSDTDISEADAVHLNYIKEEFQKWKNINEARKIIIEYATLHLGISCIHPNMDTHTWKPPYGNVS